MLPRTAAPKTLLVCQAALMTPLVTPVYEGSAVVTAADVAAGIANAIPNPAIKEMMAVKRYGVVEDKTTKLPHPIVPIRSPINIPGNAPM